MNSSRLTGYISPGSTSTKAPYHSGVGMAGGLRPNSRVISSLVKNTTARVASTWSRWSRLYSRRMMAVSITRPYSAAPARAARPPSQNEPLAMAV
ncbi:hypothetical protein D3C75_1133710 [compost metagenome]